MRRRWTFEVEADFDEDREGSVGAEDRLKRVIQEALNDIGSIGYAVRLQSKTVKRGPVKRGA